MRGEHGAILSQGNPISRRENSTLQILRPESERLKQNLEGVCLHSYNDTVNANAEVIIERCFRLWMGQALRSLRFC